MLHAKSRTLNTKALEMMVSENARKQTHKRKASDPHVQLHGQLKRGTQKVVDRDEQLNLDEFLLQDQNILPEPTDANETSEMMTSLEENFDQNMMRFKNPSSNRGNTIMEGATPHGSIRKRETRSIAQPKRITIGNIEPDEYEHSSFDSQMKIQHQRSLSNIVKPGFKLRKTVSGIQEMNDILSFSYQN